MNKIFSFVRVSDDSIVASVRIARFISRVLNIPVTHEGDVADGKIETLIIVNGAFAFCKCLPELGAAIAKARRLVWVQNDYTIIIPKTDSGAESPFRKAFRDRHAAGKPDADFWTTCEANQRATPRSAYMNWNCLTLDDKTDGAITIRRKAANSKLLYYGSFRANRVRYFDRYFGRSLVDVVISSPSRKFAEKYKSEKIEHQGKIDLETSFYNYLGQFGAGLYLEDRQSHSSFHSPANRFYEMLSAGLPMIFQPECGSMMRKAGYDPTPYYASSPVEVSRMFQKRETIGAEQRRSWLSRATAENEALLVTLTREGKKL